MRLTTHGDKSGSCTKTNTTFNYDMDGERERTTMVLRKFGAQQIRQVIRALMEASAYDSMDGRINDPVMFPFRDCMVAAISVNVGHVFRLIPPSNRKRIESPFLNTTTPTIFVVIVFSHC